MTDFVLSLVPTYGLALLAIIVCLSCLAMPVPSSLVMLTSGSFVGSGELNLPETFLVALMAAVVGDQIGFAIGRHGGQRLMARFAGHRDRGKMLEKAQKWIDERGGAGVFLSRWLVSPLGPYVNFIAGASGIRWWRFSFWGIAGEMVWVSVYIGLGLAFSDNISAVAEIASDISGLLAAGLVTLVMGWQVKHALDRRHRSE